MPTCSIPDHGPRRSEDHSRRCRHLPKPLAQARPWRRTAMRCRQIPPAECPSLPLSFSWIYSFGRPHWRHPECCISIINTHLSTRMLSLSHLISLGGCDVTHNACPVLLSSSISGSMMVRGSPGSLSWRQAETTTGVLSAEFGDICRRHVAHIGNTLGHMAHEGRFVTLAAMRHRCQIG